MASFGRWPNPRPAGSSCACRKRTAEKWLAKANAEDWDDMPSDVIGKCIEHVRGRLPGAPPVANMSKFFDPRRNSRRCRKEDEWVTPHTSNRPAARSVACAGRAINPQAKPGVRTPRRIPTCASEWRQYSWIDPATGHRTGLQDSQPGCRLPLRRLQDASRPERGVAHCLPSVRGCTAVS